MLSTNIFLSLNLDVLLEIASHLSMSDLIRLSMVRKDAAINYIARDVALTKPLLQTPDQVIPFCDYMLANASERMHRVEELTLLMEGRWEDDIERTVAVRVADLLLRTHNLRRLHLARSRFLMELDPRIQRAVADLPHLTKLVLDDGGDLTAKAVSMLRSRPRELAHDNSGYRHQKYDCSPMLFRNPSLNKTKHLHLSHLDGSSINVSRHEIIQHPSVTTLSVKLSDMDMSLFAFAFPNVRKLCLRYLYLPKSLRIQGPRAKWASLDSVSAGIKDIAEWHITCPVYSLTLDAAVSRDVFTVLPGTTSEQKGLILRAVQEMKPVCLSIEVDVLTGTPFWTQLVVSSPRLTWLEIQLVQNAQESKQAMITWEASSLFLTVFIPHPKRILMRICRAPFCQFCRCLRSLALRSTLSIRARSLTSGVR